MKTMILLSSSLLFLTFSFAASAKKKVEYRKTQEVNFDQTDIDGKVRSPDGAYLMQKSAVHFMPLYKVDNEFEKKILDSVDYLR